MLLLLLTRSVHDAFVRGSNTSGIDENIFDQLRYEHHNIGTAFPKRVILFVGDSLLHQYHVRFAQERMGADKNHQDCVGQGARPGRFRSPNFMGLRATK